MASFFGNGSSIARLDKPLSPDDAPAESVRQLFLNRAIPLMPSRQRILTCRDLRRNLLQVKIDEHWLDGDESLKEWISTFLPERQMIGLNLSNTLGDEVPIISHQAAGQTDTAIQDADESEVFLEGLKRYLIDWDEIIGTLTEDSELGVFVYPKPAGLEVAPSFMEDVDVPDMPGLRKARPKYDRDTNDRTPDHPKYGERSSRASIKAWQTDYKAHMANNLPIGVRLIKATDCAPIFAIGEGKQRLECRGIVTRTLFDVEQLIEQGYTCDLLKPNALIPTGFNPDRLTGQNGQLYLYEAFLEHRDQKTGKKTPYIARCVGGEHTQVYNRHTDENESAVINLREEYGLEKLHAGYFWGLHFSDDDPAYRSCQLMWPLMNTILGKEGLLSSSKAHAKDNAFGGHVMVPNPALPEKLLLDAASGEKAPKKPKGNQIVQTTGIIAPFSQASIGDDVKWLMAEHDMALTTQTPAPEQYGGEINDSGHAMVVGHELLTSAKRQTKEGGRLAVEFIIESAVELLCLLARGQWKMTQGKKINACIMQDVPRTIEDTGATVTVSEVIEFKDRWFGDNYRVTAKYPAVGNLAEREQTKKDWQDGAGTFAQMRESRGDQSPETTRLEIARDQWISGPIGQMVLAVEVAKKRKQMELAQKLQMQLDGEMSKLGLPTDALAPEFQGQGGGSGSGNMSLPDTAQNSLNGTVQGEIGTAAIQADAQATNQVNPGGY